MLEEPPIFPMNQDADDIRQRPPMGPLLSISGLSKQYPRTQARAVNDVSFNLYSGEILALLGPSGCGKTTTLRMLAGFETPDTGSIRLKDRDITSLSPQKRHIGMVFQDYALFPHMTLAENVTFAMQHIARDQRYAKALEWLELVGLGELADRFPEELSGGQQQRVALVRTLAAEPELVFGARDAGKWAAALQSLSIDPRMLSAEGGRA
jgi:iron(III) transport system ATP-binding protein